MTETDATVKPLQMPVKFLPYLEKYRIYKTLKDMMRDLVVSLPRDHLRHMKMYLGRRAVSSKDVDRVIVLLSPELDIDVHRLAKDMIKDLGLYVVTRRYVMDCYEKHDDYEPGCISPVIMAEVTKAITLKSPILQDGWLMYDHPCTLREARCLQQEGVLPTVTLAVMPTPPVAPPAYNPHTNPRGFFQQDFEALKFAYKATLKEVHVNPEDSAECVAGKCFNAVRACQAGAQGAGQGLHAGGAPGVYRVVLVGPRGSGRRTQAALLAKHFNLVYVYFDDLYNEACEGDDELGARLRRLGPSARARAEVVRRRLLAKDCIDQGWVMTAFPMSGPEFELLDNMETPPNRVIFLNTDYATCKARALSRGVDWCTGRLAPRGAPRVLPHPRDAEAQVDFELDFYYSEALAEMRAAAGITAWHVEATESIEHVQTKIQAAVIAAPAFDIECCAQLKDVRAD